MERPHLDECDLCFFTFDHWYCLNWLFHLPSSFYTDTILYGSLFIVHCRWAPLSLCLCLFLSVSQLPYVLRPVSSPSLSLSLTLCLSHLSRLLNSSTPKPAYCYSYLPLTWVVFWRCRPGVTKKESWETQIHRDVQTHTHRNKQNKRCHYFCEACTYARAPWLNPRTALCSSSTDLDIVKAIVVLLGCWLFLCSPGCRLAASRLLTQIPRVQVVVVCVVLVVVFVVYFSLCASGSLTLAESSTAAGVENTE